MRDDLMVLDGSAFFISERSGDIGTAFPSGFFIEDVRHLSTWQLLFDGEPAQVLTSPCPGRIEGVDARDRA